MLGIFRLLMVFCFLTLMLARPAYPRNYTKSLLVWDCDSTGRIPGLSLERKKKKQGDSSVHWQNQQATTSFSIPRVPKDWSRYNELRFWLYSAHSIHTGFTVIVSSENPDTKGTDYWKYSVPLNFVGWKEIVLPVGRRIGVRSPRGWNQVDSVAFTANGWGNSPNAKADVLLDDMRLEHSPPHLGPHMTDQEFFDQLDLSRSDLTAVRRAVKKGSWGEAKKAFLTHMRTRKKPLWRFDGSNKPAPSQPVVGGSKGWDYFTTNFSVNWVGWKKLTFPLGKWESIRKPIGWNWISRLSFSSTYGNRIPNKKTVLILDSVKLIAKHKVEASLSDFETEDDSHQWSGLQATTLFVKHGSKAGMWSQLSQRPSISLQGMLHRWSSYNALELWVYSTSATGDIITVTADSDTVAAQRADSIMKHLHDEYFLGKDIDWESNKYEANDPAFTREWTYTLNRCEDWEILGSAYWATGDEMYAREWIAQMRDWVEDNPIPLFGTSEDTLTWRTIEAGIRSSSSWPDSLYYFLNSPSLQADDLVLFLKSWVEHAHYLMRITVEHPERSGNWVAIEGNGLGHLGALLPEFVDASKWLKTAIKRMEIELSRQVYPDGAQKELSTGYQQLARESFVSLYRLISRNDIPVSDNYLRQLEKMYIYNLRVMTPDMHLPPLNDSDYTAIFPSLEEGYRLFGRLDFRWIVTGGLEGIPPEYTSVALPYAGQYVMRSDWGVDDRYLLFEAGPFGTGHQHEDKLSMFVYALGRPLLTEAGSYSYDNSKYRNYVLGASAHNTVLVDGQGQHRRGLLGTYETYRPLDNLWIQNDSFDAADGVYDTGYGSNNDIMVRHERMVIFIRPDYWVVVDWLHSRGQHVYDVLWHMNNNKAKSDPGKLSAWGADPNVANLMVTPVLSQPLELDIVKGQENPVLGFAPASQHHPIPVLDYRVRASGSIQLIWILTPFRGDRPVVHAKAEQMNAGISITIQHQEGRDVVWVLPRQASFNGGSVSKRVSVVRYDRNKAVNQM